MTAEDNDWVRRIRDPQQVFKVVFQQTRDDGDPEDEPAVRAYLEEVDAAARRVVTRGRTEELLLRIKVEAFTQAAVESHESGDETLTNLVVHRQALETAGPGGNGGDGGERQSFLSLFGLATVMQVVALGLEFYWLSGRMAERFWHPTVVVGLAVLAAVCTTCAAVGRYLASLRRRRRRYAVPFGLLQRPVPPSRSRRGVDVAVAAVTLLLTAPVMLFTAAGILACGRQVLQSTAYVGEGGRTIQLLRFPASRVRHRSMRRFLRVIEHFPRLWNLLCGHLTLVGPKPEPPEVAVRYPRDCRWVFRYRPGLIGAVFEDTHHLERDVDTYLSRVVPAQVGILYKQFLFNEELVPRLLSSAAFAMFAFRQGKGPQLHQPEESAPHGGNRIGGPGTGPAAECVRLERWSLHETSLV